MNNKKSIQEPKFHIGQNVKGKHAGSYAISGRRFVADLNEYLYEVFPLGADGEKIGPRHNQVESAFQ